MNHDLDHFRDLAWRALENPADAALRAEIAAALTAHPDWAAEWQALREAHSLAREAVPAALAREQADRTANIPAARLAALLASEAPHRRHPARAWWLAAAAALVVAAGATFWQLRAPAAPDLARWARHSPPSLARALTAPLTDLAATASLPTLRDDAGVQLQSPLLAATAGPVTIAWRAPAGTPLTLTLREEHRVIWTHPAAQSPVVTPPLAPDRVYELLLTPAQGPATRENFVTVAPTAPAAPGLDAVFTAATAEPARLGEAILAWHALPPTIRHSAAGTRLGLWLGLEARQPDLLAEARAAAARLR